MACCRLRQPRTVVTNNPLHITMFYARGHRLNACLLVFFSLTPFYIFFFFFCRQPSVRGAEQTGGMLSAAAASNSGSLASEAAEEDKLSSMMSSSVKHLAVAQPQKVLTSPFAQTLEQIAPSWPPFNPQSQKYMVLGQQFFFGSKLFVSSTIKSLFILWQTK